MFVAPMVPRQKKRRADGVVGPRMEKSSIRLARLKHAFNRHNARAARASLVANGYGNER
jgi:hypothetical protein